MKNSNKILLTLALVFASFLTYAQDSETRKLDKFYEIKVSEGIELVARKGSENKIELTVDYIDLDDVRTDIRGGSLHVHLDRGRYRRKYITAILTYTEDLERIKVNTSAEVSFEDKLEADRVEITASTSGYIEITSISAERLELSVSTGGRIDIEGDTEDVTAKGSTGATIYAYGLNAKEVTAKANTGAELRFNVTDFITATAGTGGDIQYKGKPKTDIRTNTGGSVRKAR